MMHIKSMKERTKRLTISPIADPPIVYIPLIKKFGNSPEPVVKVGDEVKKYQLVGKAPEGFSASMHSPVSGKVIKIEDCLQVGGKKAKTIIIENDFKDTEEDLPKKDNCEYSAKELLKIVEDAGIVGEGGAEFPAALKYKIEDKKVDTFILNGAECEPYLTPDYAMMSQRTEEFFQGILITNRILNAKNIVIAIEEDNKDLQDVFAPLLAREEYSNIRVKVVPNEYPQGGELQLIRTVTGMEVPDDKQPIDAGIIMNNIGTIYAVYEAVVNRRPVIDRIITVSGEKAKECGNFTVKTGTLVSHIINQVGMPDRNTFVVVGGPMMGQGLVELDVPVTKGSTGILLLEKEKVERLHCIWCAYCAEVCPMMLMPMMYYELYRKGKYGKMKKYSLESCIDCGSCEYICPSNVPLLKSIQKGKKKLKEMEDDTK